MITKDKLRPGLPLAIRYPVLWNAVGVLVCWHYIQFDYLLLIKTLKRTSQYPAHPLTDVHVLLALLVLLYLGLRAADLM